MEERKEYFVYMMINADKSAFYVGMTSNIVNRVYEHKRTAKWKLTKWQNCDVLVYYEEVGFVEEAILRERQIKALSKAKKEALVNANNPKWLDLSAGWYS